MIEREKYTDLLKKENLIDLRIIAKSIGVKSATTYKKAELLEVTVEKLIEDKVLL